VPAEPSVRKASGIARIPAAIPSCRSGLCIIDRSERERLRLGTPPKEFPRRGMNFGSSQLPEARSYADPTPICRLGPTIQRAAIQPRCSSPQPLSAVPDQASTQRAWILHAHTHRHSFRRRHSRAPLFVPCLSAHCLSTARVHLALPAIRA